MTNVFVSSRCPVASAQALDTKRLLRMCLEAYDALCGALANHRYGRDLIPDTDPIPHRPLPRFRTHNVIRWTGADRLHYQWVLAHARALQAEARWRSGKRTNCAMFDRCDAYCGAHANELPTEYEHADPLRIRFYGAFNWNEFRDTYSYAHRGRTALPAHVSLFNRYRLSLLHKWQYTDRRPSVWGARDAPWWSVDEQSHDWLQRTFGAPVHDNLQLRSSVVRESAAFQERIRTRVRGSPSLAIAQTSPLDVVWTSGQLTFSSAPAIATRPMGSVLFAHTNGAVEPTHRVVLERTWNDQLPPLIVCMLNPSTANAFRNDPTVTRVETIARRLSARGLVGGYIVVNMASLRATQPRALLDHADPVGVHNVSAVRATMAWVRNTWCVRPTVLVAWGGDVKLLRAHGNSLRDVHRALRAHGARVVCLGTTRSGEPRHPLYLPNATRLRPYAIDSRPSRRPVKKYAAAARERTLLSVRRRARGNAPRRTG